MTSLRLIASSSHRPEHRRAFSSKSSSSAGLKRSRHITNITTETNHKRQRTHSKPVSSSRSSPLQTLSTSYIPEMGSSPAGRETEFSTLREFCVGRVSKGKGGMLYVSGQPGIGKTVTLTALIRSLASSKFRTASINSMTCPTAREFVSTLQAELAPEQQGTRISNPMQTLTSLLQQPTLTVLMVDEFDILAKRSQALVLHLMRLATQAKSRLMLIGVANTTTLLHQLSMHSSGDWLTRALSERRRLLTLHFQPYNEQQITTILQQRLKASTSGKEQKDGEVAEQVFDQSSLRLIAKRVASDSGDVRKALDTCRRAFTAASRASFDPENQVNGAKVRVSVAAAAQACQPTGGRALSDAVSSLPQHAVVLLCALSRNHAPNEPISSNEIRSLYGAFCRKHKLPQQDTVSLLGALEDCSLVRKSVTKPVRRGGAGAKRGRCQLSKRSRLATCSMLNQSSVVLTVATEDVEKAFKTLPHLAHVFAQ